MGLLRLTRRAPREIPTDQNALSKMRDVGSLVRFMILRKDGEGMDASPMGQYSYSQVGASPMCIFLPTQIVLYEMLTVLVAQMGFLMVLGVTDITT